MQGCRANHGAPTPADSPRFWGRVHSSLCPASYDYNSVDVIVDDMSPYRGVIRKLVDYVSVLIREEDPSWLSILIFAFPKRSLTPPSSRTSTLGSSKRQM